MADADRSGAGEQEETRSFAAARHKVQPCKVPAVDGRRLRKIVWVEQTGGQVIRIFRSQKLAFANCEDPQVMYKDEAVPAIRRQVYDRQEGLCLWCGGSMKWKGSLFERMHMDENIPKGSGGEVSTENCQGLCYKCHILVKHGDRRPRFGETK